jgi:hypothetical protein
MSSKKQSYYEKNKDKILAQQQEKRSKRYDGLIEGYDYIICKECGFKSSELATHITNKHNMFVEEYKTKHNVTTVKSQKSLDRVKGENNPAYQHDGKFSPFSEKYIHGTKNIEEVKEKAKKNKTKDKDNTQIEYYLKKTDGNLKLAQEKLSERQSTFSLEKCISIHGKEIGKQIWSKRQEKWLKSFPKTNFSKVSQELFWEITKQLESLNDIYFAQLDKNKCKDESGKNYEYILNLYNITIKPDFIDMKNKKVIEFDGEYWRAVRGKKYSFIIEKDKSKDIELMNSGFKILRIEEKSYRKDKQGTIEQCLNFLKQ